MMKRYRLSVLLLLTFLYCFYTSSNADDAVQSVAVNKPIRAFGAVYPRISPDGETIVFSWQGVLWRIHRTGGLMTQLTTGKGFDMEPTWSPDGKQIAYINSTSYFSGPLKRIDAQTGQAVRLPTEVVAQGKLYYHPDGSQLLGNFRLEDKTTGLAWYNLKTGALSPLFTPAQVVRWLALSPDGTRIAYATTQDVYGQQTGNNGHQADLWQIPAAGGSPKKLLRFPNRIHDLCWLPGENALSVTSDLGGVHYDLWKTPIDVPKPLFQKWTFGQADEDRPSFDQRGRWLCYIDNQHGLTELVVKDLQDGSSQSVSMTGRQYLKRAGSLTLKTRSNETGQPITARVVVEGVDGSAHAPLGKMYRVSIRQRQCFFYCEGICSLDLPAGEYHISVHYGFEHRPVHRDVTMTAGKQIEISIPVERWIDQPANGWYGGENHIHANYGYGHWYNTPETMLEQCSGEQLSICNFVVANSDTDGVFDREFFRGRPDRLSTPETILYWNQEFRSTFWGHMTLVNLRQLVEPIFTGFLGTTNPWDVPTNSDIAIETHRHDGHANYTHPFRHLEDPYRGPYSAKGAPMDVALGHIDTIDINARYPIALETWYRLLNCGFRLPPSAGTDCFLNRIRSRFPGADRVYVKVDGKLTYQKWIAGLQAGHTFVTNGPMLEFSVNQKPAGDTIALPKAGAVSVKATGRSQFPLKQGELIVGGKVVATATANHQGEVHFVENLQLDESSWMAFRISGDPHEDHDEKHLYAHSAPVYVRIGKQPIASPDDAKFFLQWLDRLEEELHKRDRVVGNDLHEHVHGQLEAARKVYSKIAGDK